VRRGLPFVPLEELDDRPNVMADGAATSSTVLTLSHWPGSSTPLRLRHDLSAGIAFRYLRSRWRWPSAEVVTLDHFDQDGLVTAYAAAEPERALASEEALMAVATAGDFDVATDRAAARAAFALESLAPGPGDPAAGDAYRRALELLPDLVGHPDRHAPLWEEQDARLTKSEEALRAGRVRITEVPRLDLAVVDVDEGGGPTAGLHPIALHNRTGCTRILVLAPPHFRMYFRYETWVRLVSRKVPPRVDLTGVAEELEAAEPGPGRWRFNGVRATVARLEPDGSGSELAPELVRQRVERALADGVPPDRV